MAKLPGMFSTQGLTSGKGVQASFPILWDKIFKRMSYEKEISD